jgi:hypothetical protein
VTGIEDGPRARGLLSRVAERENLWRYAGWIAFVIAAAAYYPRYAKDPVGMVVYPKGAECLWNGQALLECAPAFTYPPAFAFVMIPFLPLSPGVRLLTWYLASIAAIVACVALSEALAKRLYPAAASQPNLIWMRAITVLLSLKFILSVLTYQSYDILVFCLMLFGLWALAMRRAMTAGGALAMAAAVKATPLIFLPYLLVKRRFAAAMTFLVVFALCSFLPDIFSALKGMRNDYLENWIGQVAGPALTPGGTSPEFFWHGWMGQTLDNQSLRGTLNRLLREPIYGFEPRSVFAAAYVIVTAAIALLLLPSPRRDEFIAVDGAILMIGMLALSPITSRYHFILLMLPYAVVAAACLCDRRMRMLGAGVLLASFVLVTGTSNDVVGTKVTMFAHAHGFLLGGTLILLIPLAAIIWLERRPLLRATTDGSSTEPNPVRRRA